MRLGLRGLGGPLLLGLAFIVAGCGGNGRQSTSAVSTPAHLQHGRITEAAYRRRLAHINRQEQAATTTVRAAVREARTVPQLRAALVGYANEQLHIGTEVGLVLPPKKADKANSLLARAFRDQALELKALLPRLRRFKNPHAALLLIEHYRPKGGRELDRAVTQLHQIGLSPTASNPTGG